MKSLFSTILFQVGLASSIFLIVKMFWEESYTRIPIVCMLVANIICGYLAWCGENQSFKNQVEEISMQCIKEYASQMAQLPLALPDDEIWSKRNE